MKIKNLVTPLDISSLEIERLIWWMGELEQDLAWVVQSGRGREQRQVRLHKRLPEQSV